MTIVLILAGLILGAALDEFAGAVFGGLIGWLLARQVRMQKTIEQMQRHSQVLLTGTPREPVDEPAAAAPGSAYTADPDLAATPSEPPETISAPAAPRPDSQAVVPDLTPSRAEAASRQWQVPDDEASTAARSASALDPAINAVRRYFTEGNLAVRVGVVILFFGVAFLFKHAADNNLVPIQLRLAGVLAGGLAMLVIGWRLRSRKPGYALVLQGGGLGVLYVTLFAAYRLYGLMAGPTSFGLLLLLSAVAMTLAVIQNARALAVTAIVGGFLAPVLASTGSGNHVALFSYYAVLNLAILGVAWFKSWRELNLIGFGFTFIIGTAWGINAYQPHNFASTEPFLILFFALYSSISVLFAMKQPPKLRGLVDGTLVFGTPIICFTLQAALVEHIDNAMAWSAVAVALWYTVFAVVLWQRPRGMRTLAEAFAALAVIFGSMAIPLALDGRWTAAAWAIEGAGLMWIGLRQNQLFPRIMAVILQLGGGVFYLFDYHPPADPFIFLNSDFLGIALVASAGYLSAFWLDRADRPGLWSGVGAPAFLCWGLLWWYIGGVVESEAHHSGPALIHVLLAYLTVSGLLHLWVMRSWQWLRLRWLLWLWGVAPFWLALVLVDLDHRPFTAWGILLWPITLTAAWAALWFSRPPPFRPPAVSLIHLAVLLTATFVLAVDSTWWLSGTALATTSWAPAVTALALCAVLAGCVFVDRWPLDEQAMVYRQLGPLVLLGVLALWFLVHYVSTAVDAAPWPYLPLLNPMDLCVAAALLLTIVGWRRWHAELTIAHQAAAWVLGAVLFIWVNTIALQSLHHWTDVPYRLGPLLESQLVQTTLTILWTIIGLGVMMTATRAASRMLWFCGAGLVGVVVLKLFTVDLSSHGTIERVVSFIGVGVLLLIVGYFSPMPPAQAETSKQAD